MNQMKQSTEATKNGLSGDTKAIRLREQPERGFCWQENECYCVFQPIIGPHATALYGTLSQKARNGRLEYTLRGLATQTGQSHSTVDRNLKVMEFAGMIRTTIAGGSQSSKCELFNLKELIRSWGNKDEQQAKANRLRTEVTSLRARLKSQKRTAALKIGASANKQTAKGLRDSFSSDFEKDAGVSLEERQRVARETQAGFHLLLEKTKMENNPSPTPSRIAAEAESEMLADESKAQTLLKWARDNFNGVIDDLRAHLLDTSKHPAPHLTNGAADWEEFGFNSFAVEGAARCGDGLALMLSASDPAAARRGLEKYRRKWDEGIRNWFGCEVEVTLTETKL